MIAALYIDPRGPYPRMLDVDCWDVSRDARLYDGPHPIVAHPPCKHWGRLRHLAHVRCPDCGWHGIASAAFDGAWCPAGSPPSDCGTLVVSDADCAPRAVEQVRRWGGVLEHPAGSLLWEHCALPRPMRCAHCGSPAACVGQYEDMTEALPACDTCCGHCCEDGFCELIDDTFGGYTVEVDQVEWGHVARKRTWLYLVGVPREALEAPPFPGREPTHWVSGAHNRRDRRGGAVPPGIKVCSAQQRRRTPPLFAEYLVRLARAARRP